MCISHYDMSLLAHHFLRFSFPMQKHVLKEYKILCGLAKNHLLFLPFQTALSDFVFVQYLPQLQRISLFLCTLHSGYWDLILSHNFLCSLIAASGSIRTIPYCQD